MRAADHNWHRVAFEVTAAVGSIQARALSFRPKNRKYFDPKYKILIGRNPLRSGRLQLRPQLAARPVLLAAIGPTSKILPRNF